MAGSTRLPPSWAGLPVSLVSRRTVLKGIAGTVSLAAVPEVLAACAPGGGGAAPAGPGTVTVGSNASAPGRTRRVAPASACQWFASTPHPG